VVKKHIGQGTYGSVLKGVCRSTKKTVVLKIIVGQAKNEFDMIYLLREISIMRKINDLSS